MSYHVNPGIRIDKYMVNRATQYNEHLSCGTLLYRTLVSWFLTARSISFVAYSKNEQGSNFALICYDLLAFNHEKHTSKNSLFIYISGRCELYETLMKTRRSRFIFSRFDAKRRNRGIKRSRKKKSAEHVLYWLVE